MNIAMVFPVFNKRGGMQRAIVELSAQLAADGHRVHVVANNWDAGYPGVTFHRVPMVRPNNPLQMASFCLASTAVLPRLIARERFDIVHSHGAATLRADIITAHSCHRAWVQQSEATMRPFSRAWLRRRLNPQHPSILAIERHQYAGHHFHKAVAVSHGVKREYTRLFGVPDNDIAVIANGVNLDEFAVDAGSGEREATRAQLGLSPTDHLLLLVANEFARKGLAPLLEALRLLPDTVHLLCVGKGNPRPYLPAIARAGIQRRVHFVPHTTRPRPYYAAADIFVFPTRYEAFALVTVEAAAAGLPLLCTRVNGTEELVSDGVNGLFLQGDPRDIAGKVQSLVENPDRRRAMGQAAAATARDYHWSNIKDQYVAVYDEVLRAKQQGAAANPTPRPVTAGQVGAS